MRLIQLSSYPTFQAEVMLNSVVLPSLLGAVLTLILGAAGLPRFDLDRLPAER